MGSLRFYLDENISPEVAVQLNKIGIDALSVIDLGISGVSDEQHLQLATEQGRVLCTHDQDFIQLAAENFEHNGIIFAQQSEASIGRWVNKLRNLHNEKSDQDLRGQFYFLSLK